MRVKSASCAPATADRAHEYPPSDTEYEVAGSTGQSNRKGFFSFLFFSIVAICIILFIVSSKHTIDIHRTEEEGGHGGRGQHRCRRQAGDAAEAGWLAVWPTHNGTTEMSQGNQACDGSSTVVARSTR